MAKLKLYLRTQTEEIEEQANVYEQAFEGKILKRSFIEQASESVGEKKLVKYVYMRLFDNINIMIGYHNEKMPEWGYSSEFILTLDNEVMFDRIYNGLIVNANFKAFYNKQRYEFAGGTYIAKFMDRFGYAWVLECKAM